MFAEFGPAPLCLELDFDTFEGPPHWVARLRQKSGWLMIAEATIQSEHDILTDKLVVACDEQETPIPSFKAENLIHCGWINPTYCDELPPDILEDLICEEEGALIARWHREKNSALAEAFEEQEARIAELEGRAQFLIARNEAQIAELRQRRWHPDATPEMRRAMAEIIRELDQENDDLLAEMAAARAAIREQAAEIEENLWDRDELLIEVTPLHLVRWTARPSIKPAPFVQNSGAMGTVSVAAIQKASLQRVNAERESKQKAREAEDERFRTVLADRRREDAERMASKAAKQPVRKMPKHSTAVRKLLEKARKTGGLVSQPNGEPTSNNSGSTWPREKIDLLRQLWVAGIDEWKIGALLCGAKTSEVIEEAKRLGLPPKENCSILPETMTTEIEAPKATQACAAPNAWTEARVATLSAMWRAGNTAGEIAKALGDTSRNAVIGKAGRLGLPRREVTSGGDAAASDKPSIVRSVPNAYADGECGSDWTPERLELLEALWLDGTPTEEIARVLGLRRSEVIGKAQRLGLSIEARPNVFDEVTASQPASAPVQNALSALSAARKRYYGRD